MSALYKFLAAMLLVWMKPLHCSMMILIHSLTVAKREEIKLTSFVVFNHKVLRLIRESMSTVKMSYRSWDKQVHEERNISGC